MLVFELLHPLPRLPITTALPPLPPSPFLSHRIPFRSLVVYYGQSECFIYEEKERGRHVELVRGSEDGRMEALYGRRGGRVVVAYDTVIRSIKYYEGRRKKPRRCQKLELKRV